jgi:hypothetical protein
MASVWRLKPEAYVDISPGAVLAAGDYGVCDEVNNSTSPYGSAWVYILANYAALSGTEKWMHVSLQTSVDGTNYHDADTWAFQEKMVASLNVDNTTQVAWAFYIPNLPPCKFSLKLYNGSTASTDGAPVVYIMRVAKELASA